MQPSIDTLTSPLAAAGAAPAKADDRLLPLAKGDKHLWGIYILLVIISVVELYSASSREVNSAGMGVYGTIIRHGAMLLAGFGIICILQRTHYRVIWRWTPVFALASVAMMVYTMFFGEEINGARRSFSLVFFSIQPAEFLKMSAAAMVAYIMSRYQLKGGGVESWAVGVTAALIMLFGGLLVPQGLTNTILLMCISFSMMIVSGIGIRRLLIVLGVYVAIFGAYVVFVAAGDTGSRAGTWVERLHTYGDSIPKYEQPITSENRQEMLGYIAQAHGGVTGVMPGNSRETSRLPLAFTDYIYSIVVEELGLIGGVAVLLLYLWLLGRASRIASRCSRAFPALLVIGMALTIVLQALFHICIVTGVIPVSGQPLPLISKGGSSIFVTSIAFGVMLSVSRFAVRTGSKKRDLKSEAEALPEAMRAENPYQL